MGDPRSEAARDVADDHEHEDDHQQESEVRLLAETALRAELTAYNAASALASDDRFAANRVLASLKLTESVLSARLFDQHGELFADYTSALARRVRRRSPPLAAALESDYLETYRPVLADNKIIGARIATDSRRFYELAAFDRRC